VFNVQYIVVMTKIRPLWKSFK